MEVFTVKRLFLLPVLLLLAISPGCSSASDTVNPEVPEVTISESEVPLAAAPITEADFVIQGIDAELVRAGEACRSLLAALPAEPAAYPALTPADDELLVEALGELGYVAVTQRADMAGYERALEFCAAVEAGQEAGLTIYEPDSHLLAAHVLFTRDGVVALKPVYYEFPSPPGAAEPRGASVIPGEFVVAEEFSLGEDGYMVLRMPEEYFRSFSFRVVPLGGERRALTRKYTGAADYMSNNLLTVDWDGEDLSRLDIRECFETFYRLDHGEGYREKYVRPDMESSGTAPIPAAAFEAPLLRHLPVTREYLRTLPLYDAEADAYSVPLIGRDGAGPVPEVLAHTANADGTLTLTVGAMGVHCGEGLLFTSTLTVRENADGSVRYLSNRTD